MEEKKVRPSLTEQEFSYLCHILRNFTDYMAGDDRHDHGWNNLKGYRNLPDEKKWILYGMTGRLERLRKDRAVKQANKAENKTVK